MKSDRSFLRLFSSLRVRCLLVGAIAFVPFVFLQLQEAESERRIQTEQARQQAVWLARIAVERQEDVFKEAGTILRLLAESSTIRNGSPAACTARLERLGQPAPWVSAIWVTNAAGETLCDNRPDLNLSPIGEREYFQRALQSRKLTVSGFVLSTASGKPRVFLIQPIVENGSVPRTVALSIDPEVMSLRLQKIIDDPAIIFAVFDRNATVLAYHPQRPGIAGTRHEQHPLTKAALGGHAGVIEGKDLDGIERVFAFEPIGDSGASLVVGIDKAPIEAATRATLRARLLWIGGILGAATLLGLAGAEWLVLTPLHRLRRLAQQLGRGDFDAARALTGGRGDVLEIADLQRSMVEMATELDAKRRELVRASETKGEFLRNMNHELRSPLTAIIGFAQLIETGVSEDEAQKVEWAAHIRESGEHLVALINDLLDMSKIEAGKLDLEREPFDATGLARSCCGMLQIRAEEAGVAMSVDAAGPVYVLGDELRTRQVLINLITNAIKYTHAGGSIVIRLRSEGGRVFISVRDTGIGMAAEDLVTALEVFGQVANDENREHRGTGLGLPLSKQLVELQDGTFAIESERGAGTDVQITLPGYDRPG